MSPQLREFHQRKHQCYRFSGVMFGKAYCQDMQEFGGENLFNCYR
jgi:hypothetical protein